MYKKELNNNTYRNLTDNSVAVPLKTWIMASRFKPPYKCGKSSPFQEFSNLISEVNLDSSIDNKIK